MLTTPMTTKPKDRPALMKVTEVHIPKKDFPTSGQFPPDSCPFRNLKKSMRDHGMRVPVFVNKDGIIILGHYRLWAWQALGHKHVPVVVVNNIKEALDWLGE